MHFAAEARRTDIVNMLLDAGADIDAQDNAGRTALTIAYAQSDHELFAALIERGAQVGEAGESARLAHDATAEAIRAIERGRDDDPAMGVGEMDRLKQLIGQGADPNGFMMDEGTPLHRVSRAVTALPESSQKVLRLGAIAEILLDAGADPSIEAGMGRPAYDITHAARFGHAERVAEFCEHDRESMTRVGLYKKTALVIAVENNQAGVVRALLERGAKPTAWIGAGRNPIETAVERASDDVVLMLLDKGFASPDQSTPLGGPLHVAADDGRMAILKPMVDAGYRVETKDMRGNTALHLASSAGQEEYAMALVQYGADPLTWNNAGETAISLAESKGHKSLYTKLKRAADRATHR
jgi:ankyrin repeat protein